MWSLLDKNNFALSIERCKTLKWNNAKLWFICPHWDSFVLCSSRSQAWKNVNPMRGIWKSQNVMGWARERHNSVADASHRCTRRKITRSKNKWTPADRPYSGWLVRLFSRSPVFSLRKWQVNIVTGQKTAGLVAGHAELELVSCVHAAYR